MGQIGSVRTVIVGNATNVRFAVTNSGATIEQAALDQIFDPFNRGSAAGLGHATDASLGLGLFIVRAVARAHGGEVDVRSAEGVTVFDVLLPRRNESPASCGAPKQAAEPGAAAAGGGVSAFPRV